MTIGLSNSQIYNHLKKTFFEELTPTVGLLSQERIAKEIADIITKNNSIIERHFEDELRKLKNI